MTTATTERTNGSESAEAKPAFQVLERTFSILDLFDEERPEWSTTEVARALDLPIPTAHRILMALKRHGYVSQHEETKRFRLGISALQLGDRARSVVDLRSVALPALRRLSAETGETALLTVLTPAGDRGVCLERVETAQPLRLSVQPGRQLPLHAGASQKALLAFMDDEAAARVVHGPLERLCHATLTDPVSLSAELETIRRRGWASSYEETNLGVWGVAVPVLSDHGGVVCAVGIAGPSARLTVKRVREDVARVHDAAERIASALGLMVPAVKDTKAAIDMGKGSDR
jgi:IclR family transcriptional regulator, acetate operon repressor